MSRARSSLAVRRGRYLGQPQQYRGPFTHGDQITKANIGPQGPLTASGSIVAVNGQIIQNLEISGTVKIPVGASVRIYNTRIIGPPSAASAEYTVKATASGGCFVDIQDSEIITQGSATKCIAGTSDISVSMKRTILRGGTDNAFFNVLNSPGIIATGDPRVPLARLLIEDCWLGDCQHPPGAHADCLQIDGGGYAVIRRCNMENFLVPLTDSVLTTEAVISQSTCGNSALICSQNSSNPVKIDHTVLESCLVNGGNYTVYLVAPDGLPFDHQYCTNNKFGLYHNFSMLRFDDVDPTSHRSGNTWAYTGITGGGLSVVAGDAIPGESAPLAGHFFLRRRHF